MAIYDGKGHDCVPRGLKPVWKAGAALVETYQGGNSMAIPKYKGEVRAGAIIRVLVSGALFCLFPWEGRQGIAVLRVTYVMLNGLRYGYG